MSEDSLIVLKGLLSLSVIEQRDIMQKFSQYGRADDGEKRLMERRILNEIRSLGPKDSICPCCGR